MVELEKVHETEKIDVPANRQVPITL